jgi:hypothetical protein
MQYRLRTLLILLAVVGVFFAGIGLVKREWFDPRDEGLAAAERFDALFAKRHWSGLAAPFFYDYRVRIDSPDVGDDELRELYPILQDIGWLRYIEVRNTRVSQAGIADLRRHFPRCQIILD